MLTINCSSTIKGFSVNVVLNNLACTFCFAGVLKTVDVINLQQEERQTTLGSLFSVSGFSVILDPCVKLTCDYTGWQTLPFLPDRNEEPRKYLIVYSCMTQLDVQAFISNCVISDCF